MPGAQVGACRDVPVLSRELFIPFSILTDHCWLPLVLLLCNSTMTAEQHGFKCKADVGCIAASPPMQLAHMMINIQSARNSHTQSLAQSNVLLIKDAGHMQPCNRVFLYCLYIAQIYHLHASSAMHCNLQAMHSRLESHLNACSSGRYHHQAARGVGSAFLVDQRQLQCLRCLSPILPQLAIGKQQSSIGSRRISPIVAAGDAAESGLPGDQGPQAVGVQCCLLPSPA
jgi:hypothetical protein